MTTDMLSWLRQQIEHRATVARAATEGGWKVGEPVPYSGPGSGIVIDADGDEIAGPGHSGGGVWKQEDAAHIIANDPRQVIADCETQLALIALHATTVKRDGPAVFSEMDGKQLTSGYEVTCSVCGWVSDDPASGCETVRWLALAYASRPGYRPEWTPEGATP